MKFASINNITLHYEVVGSGGTPIVFINSLGTNLHSWDEVAAHFDHVLVPSNNMV